MIVKANNAMILECLGELADIQFQERVWVRGEGPELSSLQEAWCTLFDDSCLSMVLGKRPVYSESIDLDILKLDKELENIDLTKSIKLIVESSDWKRISNRAEKLRQRIEEFLAR